MSKRNTSKIYKSRKKTSTLSTNQKEYYLPMFLLVVIVILGVVAFTIYGLSNDSRRDFMRREAVTAIIKEIDNFYLVNNQYPEAVFFIEDKALICTQVDCFQQVEVALNGVAKPSTDISQGTTSKSTKYGYILNNEGYSVGYCDENGETQSFGNTSSEGLLLNCN